ncbi:MAG: hypothetical protein DCC75_01820 [Proteobacteria bacterium]|nr:MAG: hypothetical protein DCC75_01820 [Pseudomonadota bacterium]
MQLSGTMGRFDLQGLNLNRLLRRNIIQTVVVSVKVACCVISILMLVWAGREFFRTSIDASAAVKRFENTIADASSAQPANLEIKREKSEIRVISEKSVFGKIGASQIKAEATPKPAANVALTLIGTFVFEGQSPYAIIEEQKKKTQEVFNIDDLVFDQGKLVAIRSDSVELDRNGKREILTLDDAPERSAETKDGVGMVEQDSYVVEEVELDRALENLPLLLTQARAVPYFKEGRAVGLRLFAIKSGSLFEKIGLQNGDILKAVNGNSLADLSQAMQLFQKLKEERNLSLSLERGNAEREFKYQIR